MQFLFLSWILQAYSPHPASFIKPNNNTLLHVLLQVQTFSSVSCSHILPIIYFCYLTTLAVTEDFIECTGYIVDSLKDWNKIIVARHLLRGTGEHVGFSASQSRQEPDISRTTYDQDTNPYKITHEFILFSALIWLLLQHREIKRVGD